MESTELITRQEAAELLQSNQQMAVLLRGMADMLRMTNERMVALEAAVRTLEKVTPHQAAALNRMIRERAAELCAEYRAHGSEADAAAAIRRAVRTATGARAAKDIARCDWQAVSELVRGWDDYQVMKELKAKGAKA